MGSVGLALPLLVLNFVADKLPAGVVGLQQTLVPMLTYAFALLFRIDRINALKLAGLAVDATSERVVVGRWRAREDYDAWARGESYLRTKSALDSCQAGPSEIEWFRSAVVMDKAGPEA